MTEASEGRPPGLWCAFDDSQSDSPEQTKRDRHMYGTLGVDDAFLGLTDQQEQKVVAEGTLQPQLHSVAPELPPEILGVILKILIGRTMERHVQLNSLATCALVNKSWNRVAIPMMCENVVLDSNIAAFRFLRSIIESSCKTRNERSHAWPGTWILRLDLWCGEGVWRTVMQNLFLFPNLRRLNLDSLHSADDLSVLFDQDLPALQELAIKPRKKPSARPSFGTWDYSYSPSIDRERSRAFFSRLSEVNFLSSLITKGTVPSLILDAAHDKLRQITFPPATPEEITTQFVSNCSDALSVLRIDMPAFSNSLSECLGTRCTGLRALDITCVEMIEPHGFECLMRVCGPHLIALRLGRAEDEGEIMDARIIRSVTSHCRSLESLGVAVHDFICDTEASFKDDLLDLVRQCGRALQYLSLSVVGWEGPLLGRAVLETIANSCPNLRYLQTDIWDVTPWDYDEQEAYNEEEAESSLLHGEGGAAAERAIFNRQVEALSKIVENCEFLKMIYLLENLENLDPPRPFLAAKLGDFVHYSCEPYFNWKRYM